MLEELGQEDIAFQTEINGQFCAGFFVCRANHRTFYYFQKTKEAYDAGNYEDDQQALSYNQYMVRRTALSSKFWTFGQDTPKLWRGEDFQINSKDILLAHACNVHGVKNKENFLSKVKEKHLLL